MKLTEQVSVFLKEDIGEFQRLATSIKTLASKSKIDTRHQTTKSNPGNILLYPSNTVTYSQTIRPM